MRLLARPANVERVVNRQPGFRSRGTYRRISFLSKARCFCYFLLVFLLLRLELQRTFISLGITENQKTNIFLTSTKNHFLTKNVWIDVYLFLYHFRLPLALLEASTYEEATFCGFPGIFISQTFLDLIKHLRFYARTLDLAGAN
jgi:hypothetical protein